MLPGIAGLQEHLDHPAAIGMWHGPGRRRGQTGPRLVGMYLTTRARGVAVGTRNTASPVIGRHRTRWLRATGGRFLRGGVRGATRYIRTRLAEPGPVRSIISIVGLDVEPLREADEGVDCVASAV
jgi:hypothetical protein